ncbi:carboxylesterase family protein [Variovorax sp. GB1R11]|uniref:carboxylesterase family protein n=1 Tax=Variovorax sp. GB1R11 TaxID=3443741 RepID=UPI003F467E97
MTTEVEIFRNIRYAHAERFEQPEVLAWDGRRHTERGPICPQSPSRLEVVQGPLAPMDVDEHCQVLSVFTPGAVGRRPVMVFIHGGGFVTGGGELPWHDGDKLAAEQDVVVVSVTYRLGVFGYLQFPSSTGPSPAMADQVAALQWVKTHISQFGGNPDNVTVFGQSAGGFSIVAMLAWGHGGSLFQRAILHSGANGAARTRDEADRVSAMFLAELGQDPRAAGVDDLIAAQGRLAATLNQLIVWAPVSPDTPSGSAVDTIAGWCKDDALPFVLLNKHVAAAPGTEVRYAAETTQMNVLFEGGARSLVQEVAARGRNAYLFRFDWQSPETGFGACHCIDLPFLLGSAQAWSAAPELGKARWTDIEALGRGMRQIWADFARGSTQGWQAGTVRHLP